MTTPAITPRGLHPSANSPVAGLMVLERRTPEPQASVICVHGGLDRAGSFARVARRLNSFDVVAYDRRGYQGSRSLRPLSLDEHVHDLQAVARDERESGPVVVLGHSYGGIVALAAAADSPELFDLVIVYETPLPWVYRRAGSHPPLGDNPALEAEMFFRRVVSDAAWERLSLAEKENRRLDGDALLDDLRVLRGPTPFDVTTVVSPLVYAYGDDERGDYYVELVRALGALVPGLRSQRLPGAGHGAHLASPDQLAAVIKKSWEDQCESE